MKSDFFISVHRNTNIRELQVLINFLIVFLIIVKNCYKAGSFLPVVL